METRRRTCETGQSLVIVAFAMVVLILFAMFAVDLSYAYVQRRQMQNAADAASLAGARELTVYQGSGGDIVLTNGQLYDLILNWARRNEAQAVQALYIRPDGSTFAINAGDGSPAPASPDIASGVYVKADTTFATFFARFVGLGLMNISAEAEASFGAAWTVRGVAPLAVLYSDFNVGDQYDLFSGNYKHTQARWGWLGLDTTWPSKYSPDANSLKQWMAEGYQSGTTRNQNYMGDPGMKASVLAATAVDEVIILPLFDKIHKYTTDERCNKDSYRYDADWCETACTDEYYHVICSYTDQTTLNGQYYYHIISFAAYKVTGIDQGGHSLSGEFVSYVVDGTWTNPSPWDKGVVVMRLTERDKPPIGATNTPESPVVPTSTPAPPPGEPQPTDTPGAPAPTDTPGAPPPPPPGELPTSTPTPTVTPCATPYAPGRLTGIRDGQNVYLSWNPPPGPQPNQYYVYWAIVADGQYGFLASTTQTSFSYKTNSGAWYVVTGVTTGCGEGPISNTTYVPAK